MSRGRQKIVGRVRRFRKEACERCGSKDDLQVHHVDGDWCNNDPSNYRTLCRPCHALEHKAKGGFRAGSGGSVPDRSREELLEAATWMAGKIWDWLEMARKWKPGREVPDFWALRRMYSRTRQKFGVSIWQGGEMHEMAHQLLAEKGVTESYTMVAIRHLEKKRLWPP